jgi:hypothetical protein
MNRAAAKARVLLEINKNIETAIPIQPTSAFHARLAAIPPINSAATHTNGLLQIKNWTLSRTRAEAYRTGHKLKSKSTPCRRRREESFFVFRPAR